MRPTTPGRLRASRSRAAPAVLAAIASIAGIGLPGCSSPDVTVLSSRPDEHLKSVSSVFVVVGSEKDLTLADATADPIELVSPARQERYEATLQFEPRKDKEGNLYWNKVLDRQRGATARVEAEVAPLAIELDGALFDELPDLAVLVLASFKDGNRAMRLLTAQQFEEVGEFVLELYGQELKQQ